MATYDELIQAANDSALIRRVRVACIVAAEDIRNNPASTAPQRQWAIRVFQNPEVGQRDMLWAVLAQNRALPLGTILGATDAQVQTAVNAAIALFTE